MSSEPAELKQSPAKGDNGPPPLSRASKLYFAATAGVALAAAVPILLRLSPDTRGWLPFAAITAAAAVAQVFNVNRPQSHGFSPAIVAATAAVLVLPLELVVLVPLLQHIPEWLKKRYPWFVQTFNIVNHTLNVLAAWFVADVIRTALGGGDAAWALAGLAACTTYVATNHVVLAIMLRLARGHRLKESGLFSLESLGTDLVLAAVGLAVVAFARENAWLIPAAIAPVVLIHRALSVPALQEEARVDPKTGLFNARHFSTVLRDEFERAERVRRPLALLMADLDFLRDVNNNFGHLAGDAVLARVAGTFRAELRHYDVPARFGGEEFSILLPDTTAPEAARIAERIRLAVEETAVDVPTLHQPLHVTVSIGVAAFPADARDPNELVHQADLAVYRAKLEGRNRVVGAAQIRLEAAQSQTTAA